VSTKVKICGITSLDDALAACDAGVDALGFNFAEEAKKKGRYIAPDAARRIVEQLPPLVMTVAVCVNQSVDRLLAYLEFIDRVQLHGEESIETCRAVGPRAIKVFRASPGFEPKSMLAYPVSAFLLDAYVRGARGGTGASVDWDVARQAVALKRPLILAGGLTPDNVADAVRTVRPYAVDTASGVEDEQGTKDHERIRRFIHNAKLPVA